MVALVALLLLRLCWLDSSPFNADEPQHAPVACWSWTQGLLPYRDVFDNHGPWFGWLESWPLRMIGGSPQRLDWLRLSVQPWYFLALASVWSIGRRLYGRGVAWAAMWLCALYPPFFLASGQFRPDDRWISLWLAALAVALSGADRPSFWRWFAAGLLAGGVWSVSQKTSVLLLICWFAALVVAVPRTLGRRRLASVLGGSLLGVAVLPLSFIGWLHAQGCLDAFRHGTLGDGLDAGSVGWGGEFWRLLLCLLAGGAGIAVSVWRLRCEGQVLLARRVFLGLQGWLLLLVVLWAWPLPVAQDFLPVLSVLAISLCGLWQQLPIWLVHPRWQPGLLALGLVLEGCSLLQHAPPWQDRLAPQRGLVREVLHYSDTAIDARGAYLKSWPSSRLR